jgi:hypothetical protein
LYPAVARRAGHRCEFCRAPEALFNFPFEVEHVLPPSRGGGNDDSNLALACRSCNVHKGNQVSCTEPGSGAEVSLFNPRRDRWADHFTADLERGEVRGLTPTGRATVEALRMNDPVQLLARLMWIRLRLFP